MKHHQYRAFTLVELSVVLVIIGLLVAGVLAAQDMIRAAEIRATVTQVEQYRTAMRMFEDKYGALPGDIPNATSFWSSECTDSGGNTCNGDNDGRIETGGASTREGIRAWQHLGLAGLIPGTYTGVDDGSKILSKGVTVPEGPISGGVFAIITRYSGNGFFGHMGNYIGFGRETSPGNTWPLEFIHAGEAWSIDKKMDDGIPSKGVVITINGAGGSNCVDGDYSSDSSANYTLNSTDIHCRIFFRID